MSPASRATPGPDREGGPGAAAPAPETVIELLNDDHARAILRSLREGPRPARELIAEHDASKPTVYRRLNRLEEAGLVESTTAIHPDGHHRKEFATDVDRVTVEFGGGDPSAVVAATAER